MRVIFHASTPTDINGDYAMHLPPGVYCLVAYKGYDPVDENDFGVVYGPDCRVIEALIDMWDDTQDFQLVEANTGNLIVEIIPGVGNEDVTLSFRTACGSLPSPCDLIEVWWETGTANATADTYTVTAGLPGGLYHVVAFTETETEDTTAAVTEDYTSTVSFDFTPTP